MPRALAIALLLLAASVSAQARSWTFTMTHLCRSTPGDPDVCLDMEGSFSGEDANADGAISLDELGSLRAGNFLFHPDWSGELNGGTTASFNYVVDGALSFHAYAAVYRVQIELETGVGYAVSGPVAENGLYAWTPETQVLVSAVVPEPATAALLGLGLLALARRGVNRRAAGPR